MLPDGRVQLWWDGVRRRGGRTGANNVAALDYAFAWWKDPPTGKLICHWPLDETEGSLVADATGIGHAGVNHEVLAFAGVTSCKQLVAPREVVKCGWALVGHRDVQQLGEFAYLGLSAGSADLVTNKEHRRS